MANFFDIKARQAAAAAAAAAGGSSKASTAKQESSQLQPWVEKYRPKSLTDVTAQDHTIHVLQRVLQSSNLPHMLFYGPPGTGKTSTILALAKQLFGPDLLKSRVLELNASDERGIAIVREKVKDFARQQLSNPPAGPYGVEYRKKYPCPPFKIVVLDEADSMTQDAQSALRRTMETYSRLTRFCLVCNYVTRIIDPLASRCSKFRFKALAEGNAIERVEAIARAERVRLDPGVSAALVRCADGDLRKAITFLQSAARLVTAPKKPTKKEPPTTDDNDAMDVDDPESESEPITTHTIYEIAGVVPDPIISRLLAAIHPPQTSTNQPPPPPYATIAAVVNELVLDGWSASQLLTQLFHALLLDDDARVPDDLAKVRLAAAFSEADKRLLDGADEHLVLLDLALRIAGAVRGG